jgi:hypothetical protein
MAYSRGTNANIIVGAAALFLSKPDKTFTSTTTTANLPVFVEGVSFRETLSASTNVTNVGYTNNGLEITFNPTFGDVMVDQLLDVAKLYKSGMQVTLKTSFAEATLENLLVSIGQKGSVNAYTSTGVTYSGTFVTTAPQTNTESTAAHGTYIELLSGDLGDYPVERSLIAVGPGPSTAFATGGTTSDQKERVYIAYRAVSISNVTVSAKRDAATTFDVEFRLLPDDVGAYGKIVDRTF